MRVDRFLLLGCCLIILLQTASFRSVESATYPDVYGIVAEQQSDEVIIFTVKVDLQTGNRPSDRSLIVC